MDDRIVIRSGVTCSRVTCSGVIRSGVIRSGRGGDRGAGDSEPDSCPGNRGDSWTARAADRYPLLMTRSLVTRSRTGLWWRTATRLGPRPRFSQPSSRRRFRLPAPMAQYGARTRAIRWWAATQVYIARYEDTLLDIARRFAMGLAEIRLANPGVDIWLPGAGTAIRLPSRFILPEAPRSGLVINVAEMRIYYYPKDRSMVRTWPISIGRVGWETPLGQTSIVRKKAYPTWYPPESIREEGRQERQPAASGRRSRAGQPAGVTCTVSRIPAIPDPWDQQAFQHRHAGQPRMRTHVSGTYRGTVRGW